MRAWLLALLAACAVNLCGCVTLSPPGMHWPDDALVYHPTDASEGNWQPDGLVFEDVWFQSHDGVRLHGWYCPHGSPRAVVLVAHGNAGNLSDRAPMMRLLQQRLDVAAMIFDYRGYGKSQGSPSEKGLLEDARAARKVLARRAGVAESEIVLLGRSLGGGVMVDLAARDGARGLILESTFTSMGDLAAYHFPLLLGRRLMKNKFDSLSKIGDYQGPLLMSHGDADQLVPIDQGRELFKAASGPKQFVRLRDEGHNWQPDRNYIERLDWFIETLKSPQPQVAAIPAR